MDECVFCRIIRGELPSKKVYEDSHSMAFLDINPRNPGHTVVVPKGHSQDIFTIPENQAAELMKAITRVSKAVKKATGTKGINITQNNGQLAGQVVPHIHFHVIPRTEAEKGMGLESVIPVKPQDEASLDSMAKKISGAIPRPSSDPQPKKAEPKETEPTRSPEEPPKEEPSSDDPRSPEKQKIEFDF